MNEWQEHNGGERPVDPDVTVRVKFRPWLANGETEPNECIQAMRASSFRWTHDGSAGDIVLYQVVTTTGKPK